ncbi:MULTISPECIES: hypothetical protein [Streptomyces]|uniref:LPXTG cell wall anchor domain-containing protein n=2 Tax=Streptomyces TaxID=1883 RepID=A0ABU2RV47_9ACTN|nr:MULTISPECIES: hypothetical protein [unclassified Streptomyces]MBK3591200.1 hypothetical protein [Streptomyces sp. MBT51]MDT0432716.1 hypothetical protein [Streptomyces sp. DSM 41770]HBF83089.1 hypothetical protein [Streptomyces sp.]
MSIARRTLLTTTAAGTLLCALWFVPSANATDGAADRTGLTGSSEQAGQPSGQESGRADGQETLADTGTGVDTTPYLVGGTLSLCVGAGFVAYSVRRDGAVDAGA